MSVLLHVSVRGDTMKGGCFGARKCVMVSGEKERRKEGGRERKRDHGGWMQRSSKVLVGTEADLAALAV